MSEEGLDLWLAHMGGVAFSMKEDESFDPCEVALFGAVSIVLSAQDSACTLEQFVGRHENPLLEVRGEFV